MSGEPIWLTPGQIESLNKIIVNLTGEDHLLRSRELLESAAIRPRNLFIYENERDLVVLAVRLIEAIGKAHCFLQGNKRTAFVAGRSFLRVNGVPLRLPDSQRNAKMIEGLIIGTRSFDAVVETLRAAVIS